MKYRKKPVVVEAVKWNGINKSEIEQFAGDNVKIEIIRDSDAEHQIPIWIDCSIKTLEGIMSVSVGDYIVKGVNGEFYPCKPDVFEKIHDEVFPKREATKLECLKESASPLIKFLCENYNPHVTAIVTSTGVEVLEGIASVPNINDYIID